MERNYFPLDNKNIYLWIVGSGLIICFLQIILWEYNEIPAAIIGQDVQNAIKIQELELKILELELEVLEVKFPAIETQTNLMVIKTFIMNHPQIVTILANILINSIYKYYMGA